MLLEVFFHILLTFIESLFFGVFFAIGIIKLESFYYFLKETQPNKIVLKQLYYNYVLTFFI